MQDSMIEISVKVNLSSLISQIGMNAITKKKIEINLYLGNTVRDLLIKLNDKLGDPFQKNVFDSETSSLIQNTIVFINGKALQTLNGLDTVLAQGDVVMIGRAYTSG